MLMVNYCGKARMRGGERSVLEHVHIIIFVDC